VTATVANDPDLQQDRTALRNFRGEGETDELVTTHAPRGVEESVRLLSRLLAISGSMAAARTPAEVAVTIVKECSEVLRARMGLFVQPTEGGQLEIVACHGLADAAVRGWSRLSVDEHTPVGIAYRTGEPLWVESSEEFQDRFGQQPHARGRSSAAALPLVLDGRVLGVVAFCFDGPRVFAPDERALLLTMAAQAAQAFERSRAYAGEIAARLKVEALRCLSEALAGALGTSDVASVVIDRGMQMAGADACALHLVEAASGILELMSQRGCSPQVVESIRRITPESPLFAALAASSSIWIESPEDYAAQYPSLATMPAEGRRARAWWSVPLIAEGRTIGQLGMGFHEAHCFPPEEREFIGLFSRQCAEALVRAGRLDAERRAHELAERVNAERKLEEVRRAFLADATAALAQSLDYESTLAKVARLAVPGLADCCVVDVLPEGHGVPKRLAVACGDPAKSEAAHEIDAGVPGVLRAGRSEMSPDTMCVPLPGRGRVFGAMTFSCAQSGRRYTLEDLHCAEELARRCAIAIENARLYASEQAARKSADVANRAKDEFLAVVSHELRTPLNAIMGWAKMLSSQLLDEARRGRAIETIDRNAVAMAQLIDDLLDVSRIISGKMRLEIQRVDAARVIDAAIEAARPAAEAKSVAIVASLDRSVPAVSGDPNRLQQIVWNLLSNAVKFTPANGRVEIGLAINQGHVEIRVEDTGRGIAPSFLPYVFDAFRQEDTAHTRSRGGLGLGLAITKQLVELHGGRIEAGSQGEGFGAVFRVHLPVPAVARTGDGPTSRRSHFEKRAELEGLRVLVVDDDADARELVQAVLESSGCRVTVAEGADPALDAIAREVPDVLLSDVGMPGRDGYDLIREMRLLSPEKGGSVPAAALTAYARAEDRRRLLDAGFSMHLAKPVEPAELVAVVASLARFARTCG
jgi:signal transduction histidine kinase/CheY-like chemotaxis protein